MTKEHEILLRLESLEGKADRAALQHIIDEEFESLGHRIRYDPKTGWSTNVYGCHCDPSLLDEQGYRVR